MEMKKKTSALLLFSMFMLSSTALFAQNTAAADDIGPDESVQAQEINATFDAATEITTVSWRNVESTDINILKSLWNSTYMIYRHDLQITEDTLENATLIGSALACNNVTLGMDASLCSGVNHAGHSIDYQVGAGVNGEFYYGITTVRDGGEITSLLSFNASSMWTPLLESASDVRTPYYLQANFDPYISETRLTWVNYNIIDPGRLPIEGDDAYQIHVWQHPGAVNRSNGASTLGVINPIAVLDAGVSEYNVTIPESLNREMYYTVTYLLPNWVDAGGQDYEDFRFLSGNTLDAAVLEDTTPPYPATNVVANFVANGDVTGMGNTTITWNDALTEEGESYKIWRSAHEFTSSLDIGVELIATVTEDVESFKYAVPRGNLGYSYYCVSIIDRYGFTDTNFGVTSCSSEIFEDAFSPWIAEPTNVNAEYLGGAKTKVTWTDQLGAEGEFYHVWWSSQRIAGHQFAENQSIFHLTTIADGFGEAIVDVPLGELRLSSYYYVTSEARYGHIEGAGTYEYRGLIQNVAPEIVEDTQIPTDPALSSVDVYGFDNTAIVRWTNMHAETNETYHLYRHSGDPFMGGSSTTSNISNDTGWELLTAQDGTTSVTTTPWSGEEITQVIELPDDVDRDVWYAVIIEDQYGNVNPRVLRASNGGNTLAVSEDTRPPVVSVELNGESSGILTSGSVRVIVQLDEDLATVPMINISTQYRNFNANNVGTSDYSFDFTTLQSANAFDPNLGPTYYYDFSVLGTDKNANLTVQLSMEDKTGNTLNLNITNWTIDSIVPVVVFYSPGDSSDTIYQPGEAILITGGATDDVSIETLQIRFISGSSGSMWMDLTDTTETENGYSFVFRANAGGFVTGTHRVEVRALDGVGNEDMEYVTFTVDECHHRFNGTTECKITEALKDPVEAVVEELSFTDPPYVFVFALAAFNLFAILAATAAIAGMKSGSKRRDDDEDEGDDWMKEFLGTSSEPDMDEVAGVKQQQLADDDDDDDDPFATNQIQRKERRKKKGEDDDDGDDDDKGGRRLRRKT